MNSIPKTVDECYEKAKDIILIVKRFNNRLELRKEISDQPLQPIMHQFKNFRQLE